MKTLSLVLLRFVFGCFTASDGLTISDAKVICTIRQTTTTEQLTEYRNELWEKKKIRLDVEQINRNKDNLITQIKTSIDCNDGFKGSAHFYFNDADSKMSFCRIYEKDAASPFGIGEAAK